MNKNLSKTIMGLGLSTVLASSLVAGNPNEKRNNESIVYDVTAIATTNNVLGIGAAAKYKYFKVGAGYLRVNDIESKYGVKDKFNGGYVTLEAKTKILDSNFEVFADGTYLAGNTETEDISISKGLLGGGIIYDIKDYDLKTFIGGTSEESGYVGIEKKLGTNWSVSLGVNNDFKHDSTSGFFTLTYNFGSGFVSNISTMAHSVVESQYKTEFTKKHPQESISNPSGKLVEELVIPTTPAPDAGGNGGH